jgi:hypothetical protein
MRKLAYIALERLNNLRYLCGELRIFLLKLGIIPYVMVGLSIRTQLTSKNENILPPFFSTNQLLPRIGSAPSKGHSERYNAP